ncbi:MAG: TIGR00730 family Rossman fold protein [Bacteroidetes bacterium]|nr:TIGR00730 family Rossman fold protein [Bacteroidota bacterium]
MNICVFCGSSDGVGTAYLEAAKELGRLMAENGHRLIYGGADIGLMGSIADAVLDGGGEVTGIIPSFLFDKEIAHRKISQLMVVGSMHERKKRMAELADAFVALPGGWGTLEELAEILTWKQLHLISKPALVLNTQGFFNSLLDFMKHSSQEGFLQEDNLKQILVAGSPAEVLTLLQKK